VLALSLALAPVSFSAEAVQELLAPPPPSSNSALVQRLLERSAEKKIENDAARRDYSKQYSGYFSVLKGVSNFVPATDEERAKLGYEKPVECAVPFFQASEICKAFEGREAKPGQ
jgi:hypothetical protein